MRPGSGGGGTGWGVPQRLALRAGGAVVLLTPRDDATPALLLLCRARRFTPEALGLADVRREMGTEAEGVGLARCTALLGCRESRQLLTAKL